MFRVERRPQPPRFERRVTLLEPGPLTRGPTGQPQRGAPVEHAIRASRHDVPLKERLTAALQLSERVTLFAVRRGDLTDRPDDSWRLRDDRGDLFDVVSVDTEDGRRDDDPHGLLMLTCSYSQEVR